MPKDTKLQTYTCGVREKGREREDEIERRGREREGEGETGEA